MTEPPWTTSSSICINPRFWWFSQAETWPNAGSNLSKQKQGKSDDWDSWDFFRPISVCFCCHAMWPWFSSLPGSPPVMLQKISTNEALSRPSVPLCLGAEWMGCWWLIRNGQTKPAWVPKRRCGQWKMMIIDFSASYKIAMKNWRIFTKMMRMYMSLAWSKTCS